MTEPNKDSFFRWLPTAVMLFALIGNIFYFGARLGASETKLEIVAQASVTRAEYSAVTSALIVQINDMKLSFRDISMKLDRIYEQGVIHPKNYDPDSALGR